MRIFQKRRKAPLRASTREIWCASKPSKSRGTTSIKKTYAHALNSTRSIRAFFDDDDARARGVTDVSFILILFDHSNQSCRAISTRRPACSRPRERIAR